MNRMDAPIHPRCAGLFCSGCHSAYGHSRCRQLVFVTHEPLPLVQDLANRTCGTDRAYRTGTPAGRAAGAVATAVSGGCAGGAAGTGGLEQPQSAGGSGVCQSRRTWPPQPAPVSAIYTEPPLSRQLALIRLLLGEGVPVGVLLQDRAFWPVSGLAGLDLAGAGVTPYYLSDYDSLNHALLELLRENRALLGVYDPQLYNAANIKTILISAYRRSIPLLGAGQVRICAPARWHLQWQCRSGAAVTGNPATPGLQDGRLAGGGLQSVFPGRCEYAGGALAEPAGARQ